VPNYAKNHPAFRTFAQWAGTAPWTSSYADQSYNGLNAFRFVDKQGTSRAVRWAMVATTPAEVISDADRAALPPNFLESDLKDRLKAGELRWNLVVTVADPTDPTNDVTRAWPAEREQVEVGSLVIQAAQDEADGPCRDYNYDPLILPAGIEPSDDPLLAARSAAYAESFDRRTEEAEHYPRTPAVQKGAGQ
jgi:catalase